MIKAMIAEAKVCSKFLIAHTAFGTGSWQACSWSAMTTQTSRPSLLGVFIVDLVFSLSLRRGHTVDRNFFWLRLIAPISILLYLASAPVPAQWFNYRLPGTPRTKNGKPNLSAPAPRTRDGKPDLSGVWRPIVSPKARNSTFTLFNLAWYMPAGGEIPMLPWAAELHKQRLERMGVDLPSTRCLPHGITLQMMVPQPIKIVQNPGLTIVLYEEKNNFRQIFTDGRPLPANPDPAWFGYSVGKWSGTTFIAETVGFNDQTWLDLEGHPHTEAMRLVERFQRRNFGHMELQVTIDDPKTYSKPLSLTFPLELLPDTDLIEAVCEAEKDLAHMVGK
jgi:hypothetical protein